MNKSYLNFQIILINSYRMLKKILNPKLKNFKLCYRIKRKFMKVLEISSTNYKRHTRDYQQIQMLKKEIMIKLRINYKVEIIKYQI